MVTITPTYCDTISQDAGIAEIAILFTARCTIVQNAVLRLHVVCPSVCLCIARSVSQPIGRHAQLTRSFSVVAELLVGQTIANQVNLLCG